MAGFGSNIEEILLRVRAEGRGEVDALKRAHAGLTAEIDRMFASIREGEEVVQNTRGIARTARDVKLLEDAIRAVDPAFKQFVQGIDEMTRKAAESFQSRAAAAAEAAAAEKERIDRGVAARSLAEQKRVALEEQAAAAEKERIDRGVAARSLAEQKKEAMEERSARAAELRAARRKQADEDVQALQAHFGQMDATRQAAEQERLREAAAVAMQATQARVARAREADIAIEQSFAKQKAAVLNYGEILSQSMRREARESFLVQRGRESLAEAARKQAIAERQMTDGSKNTSYALLHMAHALQDAQYGFGAVLNNIPLVVQGLGFGPGVAGTMMIAGTAATVLAPHLKEVGIALGLVRDTSRDAAIGLDAAKEKLEAMTSRPWKLAFDYQEIQKAEREISVMERRVAKARAAMGQLTPDQQLAGAAVTKAVVEQAGGVGNLVELARQGEIDRGRWFETHPESGKLRDLEAGRQANLARVRDTTQSNFARNMARALASQAERSIASIKDRIDRAQRQALEGTIGRAMEGDESGINAILKMQADSPDLFAGGIMNKMRPVKPGFGAAMQLARPAAIAAQKAEDARQAEIDAEFEESERLWKEGAGRRSAAKAAKKKAASDAAAAAAEVAKLAAEDMDPNRRHKKLPPLWEREFDPVTGARMTDDQRAAYKADWEEGQERVRQRKAAEAKAARDAARAKTPEGRREAAAARRLAMVEDIGRRVQFDRPDLGPANAGDVAERIMQLLEQSNGRMSPVLAMQRAMNELTAGLIRQQMRMEAEFNGIRSGFFMNQNQARMNRQNQFGGIRTPWAPAGR